MIVGDVYKNRYRVNSILSGLQRSLEQHGAENIKSVLNRLAREELFSQEQFTQLSDLDVDMELQDIVVIIKETKVGRGIAFLPRSLSGLADELAKIAKEFIEKEIKPEASKLEAVMADLLRRKGISRQNYKTLKDNLL